MVMPTSLHGRVEDLRRIKPDVVSTWVWFLDQPQCSRQQNACCAGSLCCIPSRESPQTCGELWPSLMDSGGTGRSSYENAAANNGYVT